MLGVAMYITIKTLWEKSKNKSEISRLTGHDWKTVDKVIKEIEQGREEPFKKVHPSKLDPYQDRILEWIEEDLTGVRIHEELISLGVKTAYSTVRDFVRNIKKREKICIRFHSSPGEEGQVDFGYVGLLRDENGKKKKAWVFNMRLSYSRLDYYEIVFDQKVETFIQCHINAFKYFGGVPEYVKIDNLKSAILEANFYEPVYQELYKIFANYYGFKPIPCRVRKPQEKGKVESGIKYVKRNFFLGRKFIDINDAKRKLAYWLEHTCNARVHGTTRKIPRELFDVKEKNLLKQLPQKPFGIPETGTRKVYHDCHVYVKYNYYSVPYEYVGKEVDVQIAGSLVKIYYKNNKIAVHALIKGRGQFSTDNSHYPKYKVYLSTEYQEEYQVKMSNIGKYALQFFWAVKSENPVSWNRMISGILNLKKKYPEEIINSACKRALYYNALQYQMVKNICANGSYSLPLDEIYLKEDGSYECD